LELEKWRVLKTWRELKEWGGEKAEGSGGAGVEGNTGLEQTIQSYMTLIASQPSCTFVHFYQCSRSRPINVIGAWAGTS
jgi:hypothetical protein